MTTKTYEKSEKYIERYLVRRVEALGGICLKYSNMNQTGYPDRLCLLPGGITLWVELKSKGCHPSRLQEIRFLEMKSIGHPVHVCDSIEAVNALFDGRIILTNMQIK
jgi:hypothetical protein